MDDQSNKQIQKVKKVVKKAIIAALRPIIIIFAIICIIVAFICSAMYVITLDTATLKDGSWDNVPYASDQYSNNVTIDENGIASTDMSAQEVWDKLIENNSNIKEYIKEKNYAFVNLNEKVITEFKLNTVYRYTGPCCLETADNNQIIISFNYNNQKIRSYTSRKNWINASILSNYTDPGTVLHCNCYFFFHQGKVFKFLQVSEADISAEI